MPAAIDLAAGTKKRLLVALGALVFPRFAGLVPYAYGHEANLTIKGAAALSNFLTAKREKVSGCLYMAIPLLLPAT